MASASTTPKSEKQKRGPNVAGDKAKETMLKVAASLFARHGYEGVSTREITKIAKLNQAALYYHFGTKRDIFVECVLRCFDHIAKERLMKLVEAEARKDSRLEDILRAFIEPHVRYVTQPEGADYLRIFATFPGTPRDITDELYNKHFAPVRLRFINSLRVHLPDIGDDALHRSFSFLAEMLVSALFDPGYQATSGRKANDVDTDQFVDLITCFTAAGMRALQTEHIGVPE